MCPSPFFEATLPVAAPPDPRLKPGPVFVSSGGVKKPLQYPRQVPPNVLFAASSYYWDPTRGGTKSGLAHGMRATEHIDQVARRHLHLPLFVHGVPNLKGIGDAEHDVVVVPPSGVQNMQPIGARAATPLPIWYALEPQI